jgi:hypothetical protein
VSTPQVHVHIGAITVRGFSARQRDELVAGLRAELSRLLCDPVPGGAFTGRSIGVLNGGRLALRPDASAAVVGRAAAKRIAGSLRS